MGEFGRTPRINGQASRDHWPQCYFSLWAGGGVRGGTVIGDSDASGSAPLIEPTASGQEIVAVGQDGKDRRTLASGGINNWPAYSPDGARIAFASNRDGDYDIFVVKLDGAGASD